MKARVFKADRKKIDLLLLLSIPFGIGGSLAIFVIALITKGIEWMALLASLFLVATLYLINNLWRSLSHEIVLLDKGVLFKFEKQIYIDWGEIVAFTTTHFKWRSAQSTLLDVWTRADTKRNDQSLDAPIVVKGRVPQINLRVFEDPPEVIVDALRERHGDATDVRVAQRDVSPTRTSTYGGFIDTRCDACGYDRQPGDPGSKHRCPRCRAAYIVSNAKRRRAEQIPDYTPNHIPMGDRIRNGILGVLIGGYAIYGFLGGAIHIPAKRSSGMVFSPAGLPWISACLALIALSFLSVVADHYDKRDNEFYYAAFSKVCLSLAFVLYTLALFSEAASHR